MTLGPRSITSPTWPGRTKVPPSLADGELAAGQRPTVPFAGFVGRQRRCRHHARLAQAVEFDHRHAEQVRSSTRAASGRYDAVDSTKRSEGRGVSAPSRRATSRRWPAKRPAPRSARSAAARPSIGRIPADGSVDRHGDAAADQERREKRRLEARVVIDRQDAGRAVGRRKAQPRAASCAPSRSGSRGSSARAWPRRSCPMCGRWRPPTSRQGARWVAGCVTGRTWASPMSSNEAAACVTWNKPKLLPGPCAQAGTLVQPGTISASRRIFSNSSCRSPGARLGLSGRMTALQQTATLISAASGPRGSATPTRDQGPIPADCNCAEIRRICCCRPPNVSGAKPGHRMAGSSASRAAWRSSTSPIVEAIVGYTPASIMQ